MFELHENSMGGYFKRVSQRLQGAVWGESRKNSTDSCGNSDVVIESRRRVWSSPGRCAIVEGQVTNNEQNTKRFAKAPAEYYIAEGTFITVDT